MFTSNLIKWHKTENNRTMPWKGEKDPYKIWLSEIILQQTRVQQGLAYYERFIEKFPNVEKLALAKDEEVFKLWEGLGYYSRCRNLILTARFIHQTKANKFPNTYQELINLKGVGPYTASAIASFAFGLPNAVVDGNVSRVLSRYFGSNLPIDSLSGKKYFLQLAQELLCKKDPAVYNQAIMDFGATICKPQNPLCSDCVMQKECIAYNTGTTDNLPIKEKKLTRKKRHFYYFLFIHNNRVLVNKRSSKDIWQDLSEFHLYETNKRKEITSAFVKKYLKEQLDLQKYKLLSISDEYKQQLTHQNIEGVFVEIGIDEIPALLQKMLSIKIEKLSDLAFPKLINEYLSKTNWAENKQ